MKKSNQSLVASAIHYSLLVFILSTVGCSAGDSNETQEKIVTCDLITTDYIKNKFPGAADIKAKSKPYGPGVCVFNFKVADKKHYIKFEIHEGNSKEVLAKSIRNRGPDGTPLEGIGKQAFQDKKIGQVNIWTGKHVFQVNATDGNKYSVELATKIARDFLDKL
jgi:hypothetical protein